MTMRSVGIAQGFRFGAMSSLGDATNMFMRQFNFPAEFDPLYDKLMSADSDRLLSWDYEGFRATLMKFVGSGECAIGYWMRGEQKGAQEATDEIVMAFIQEALKAGAKENHPGVKWTGWRVTGTVHRGNGYPIYTLSLFANNSGVKVYSDELAPNVERPSLNKMFGMFGLRRTEDVSWATDRIDRIVNEGSWVSRKRGKR